MGTGYRCTKWEKWSMQNKSMQLQTELHRVITDDLEKSGR